MARKSERAIRVTEAVYEAADRVRARLQEQANGRINIHLGTAIGEALDLYEKVMEHGGIRNVSLVDREELKKTNENRTRMAARGAWLEVHGEMQALAIEWLLDHAVALEGAPDDLEGKAETLRRARKNAGVALMERHANADPRTKELVENMALMSSEETANLVEKLRNDRAGAAPAPGEVRAA